MDKDTVLSWGITIFGVSIVFGIMALISNEIGLLSLFSWLAIICVGLLFIFFAFMILFAIANEIRKTIKKYRYRK